MTTPTFDIRLDTNSEPGVVSIEIYEVTDSPDGRASDTRTTLAVTKVPNRGDIPGDGDSWFDTGIPTEMVEFAMLPDWIRNDALNTLAQGYIKLMDSQREYNTHTKNA